MAAIGLIRLSVAAALRDLGQPATCRQVAACAQVGIQATRWALSNMLRDGDAMNGAPVRVAGVKRPVPTYLLPPEPHAPAGASDLAALAAALSPMRVTAPPASTTHEKDDHMQPIDIITQQLAQAIACEALPSFRSVEASELLAAQSKVLEDPESVQRVGLAALQLLTARLKESAEAERHTAIALIPHMRS